MSKPLGCDDHVQYVVTMEQSTKGAFKAKV